MTDDITCLSCGAVGPFPCSRRYMSRHDENWNFLVIGACLALGWKPKKEVGPELRDKPHWYGLERTLTIPREVHEKAVKKLSKALGGEK